MKFLFCSNRGTASILAADHPYNLPQYHFVTAGRRTGKTLNFKIDWRVRDDPLQMAALPAAVHDFLRERLDELGWSN